MRRPTITAMEFGANTCAVARASVRSGAVHVSAMEVLDPTAFPGSEAFSKGLKQARKALKLPRRLRAVVWGLPDGATRKDPAVAPIIEPLVNAGFRVDRVVTPCNALAALARLRTPRFNAATCWLAINRDGVAIVAVRPGKLLYSNSFIWNSSVGATGSQARLLQRYSLVSMLAPEVTRAMDAARDEGTPVEGIVTCGNLPDLRSLTMPLIEELDVEVETLDSLEGLVVKPGVGGQIGDAAAAIRIACGAATARGTRPSWSTRPSKTRRLAVPVAAVLATFVAGWFAYARLLEPAGPAPKQSGTIAVNRTAVHPPAPHPAPSPQPAAPKAQPAVPNAGATATGSANGEQATVKPPAPKLEPPAPKPLPSASTAQSSVLKPQPPPPAKALPPIVPAPRPPARSPQPATRTPPPAPPRSQSALRRPEAARTAEPVTRSPQPAAQNARPATRNSEPPHAALRAPHSALQPVPALPAPPAPKPSTATVPSPLTETPPAAIQTDVPKVAPPTPLNAPASHADNPDARQAARTKPLPPLLKDPLPRVTAILVANDRRFATIDEGHIITIGDVIGRRTVVAIDERSVVLREPSGVQIRVGLGGKLEGVGKTP